MKKRAVVCFVAIASLCGILGVKNYENPQEPVVIETVNETLNEQRNDEGKLKLKLKAAVLMDADTGKVIYAKEEHKELPPASVTKVMTMLLAMEAVDSGKVSLTDKVTVSQRAASMGGSQMYMEAGETHTLEELLEGIAIVSANDACVAVSEYIAGSEEVFVEKMNERAEELGMRDTHFVNTNGLPVAEHYTSAYDIALMSQKLLQFPQPKKWFNTWQKTVRVGLPGKEKEFGLTNTNKLIRSYRGANGIKTGFTADAGYCLSASATRDNTTLIAVALGAETSKTRNGEIAKLLDYGFATYKTVTVAEKNQKMKKITLAKGEPYTAYATTKNKVTAFVSKDNSKKPKCKVVLNDNIKLPLKKGAPVGTISVYVGKEKTGEYTLISDREVKKASFFTYCLRLVKNLF